MRINELLLAVGVSMAALTGSASGAGWTGLYLGVQGGIETLKGDEAYVSGERYGDWEAIGGTVGVFGGYDVQIGGSFVLGIGGEINWVSASAQQYDGPERIYQDWQAAVQVRAGVLASPDVLVYGLLGYSWAGFDASEYWADDVNDGYVWTGSGVKVGAGVEVKLADNLFVKGEADMTFYDQQVITFVGDPYWLIDAGAASAKIGLGLKF
jgi:opacity protein-like surface antigen